MRLQIDRTAAQVVDKGNTANQEDVYDYSFTKTQYELLQNVRAIAERAASASDRQRHRLLQTQRLLDYRRCPGDTGQHFPLTLRPPRPTSRPALIWNGPQPGSFKETVPSDLCPERRLVHITYSDPNPGARAKDRHGVRGRIYSLDHRQAVSG